MTYTFTEQESKHIEFKSTVPAFVKLTFYYAASMEKFESNEEAILELLKQNETVTATEVANSLSISRNTALRKLNNLIAENKIKKIGGSRTTKYTI